MNDFYFAARTDIVFGRDKECFVGEGLKTFGAKNVLVVFGKGKSTGSVSDKNSLISRIMFSLDEAGVRYVLHGGVSANPTKRHTLEGLSIAQRNGVDFVLAVGGGSVIDEAKGIAAGLIYPNIWEFYQRKHPESDIKKAVPIGVVLTIPAAGSEGSVASVIRDEETGVKFSIHSDAIRPSLAFINPALCFTLPKEQIANGASDILAHLMERFFSPQQHTIVSDYLLVGAMRALINVAPRVQEDNTNYNLWAEMCVLGTLAHNGMLDMGRTSQDWGTHILENKVLSGLYNIAHGTGLAVLFPAWLAHVSKSKPERIVQFSKEVFFADGATDKEIIDNGIAALCSFYKKLGLPATLFDVGISAEEIIAKLPAFYSSETSLGSYGKLNLQDLIEIIRLAE